MPRIILAAVIAALTCCLSAHCQPAAAKPNTPDPHPDPRLDWWRQARFGMFIHWGIYSVPAGEWKGKTIDGASEWIMSTAKIPVSEYEPLAPQFNPRHFDPSKIVGLAKQAGMKYLVITSKHHDGFCMFDTKLTDWSVMHASPFHRDVVGEMAAECRREGIHFGVYYSIMDWHHPDAHGADFPKYVEYLRGQVTELIQNYNPDILWFDGEWIEEWTPELGDDLYKLCRTLRPDIIVNNRVGKGRVGTSASQSSAGDFGTPEQEIPSRGLPGYDWETCMTFNDSWGFKAADHNWKSSVTVIQYLADIASKGGNFLLNIGPTRDGEVPAESVQCLEEVGEWMKVNGESIYGTGPSPFARLPWGRCTSAPGKLYMHVFDWNWPRPRAPDDTALYVPGLRNTVIRAVALANPTVDLFSRRRGDEHVVGNPHLWTERADTVIRLEIEGTPDAFNPPLRPAADGVLTLRAEDAILEGPTIQTQTQDGKVDIGFWINPTARALWDAELPKIGAYTVELDLACQPQNAGGQAVITVGSAEIRITIPNTGSWSTFGTINAGTLTIPTPGPIQVIIAPGDGFTGALMNLREVRLIPAAAPK